MKGRPPPGPSERAGSPTPRAQSGRPCGRARGAGAVAPWRAARIPGARTSARASETPAGRPLRSAPPAPSPAEPRTASPGGRAGCTAPTRAPRGASEVWTRKYMGRPAAARARERTGGRWAAGCGAPSRTATRRGTCHSHRAGPRRPTRARAAAPGSARRCSRAGPAPARTPRPLRRSPPRPHGRAARGPVTSWRSPAAGHAGVPGLGVGRGGGRRGPERLGRSPASGGGSHTPARRRSPPRHWLPAPSAPDWTFHSFLGRACTRRRHGTRPGACPAAVTRLPPPYRRRPPKRVSGAYERARAARPRCPPGGCERGPRPFLASVARPVGSTEHERWRQPALASSAPRSVRWTTGWVSHRRAAGAAARDAWNSPHSESACDSPEPRGTWLPLCLIRCVLDPQFSRLTDDHIKAVRSVARYVAVRVVPV